MKAWASMITIVLLTGLSGCLFTTQYVALEKESPGEIMYRSVDSMRQLAILSHYDSFQLLVQTDLDANEKMIEKLNNDYFLEGNTNEQVYITSIQNYRLQNKKIRTHLKEFDKETMTWEYFKSAFSCELSLHSKKLKEFYMQHKV